MEETECEKLGWFRLQRNQCFTWNILESVHQFPPFIDPLNYPTPLFAIQGRSSALSTICVNSHNFNAWVSRDNGWVLIRDRSRTESLSIENKLIQSIQKHCETFQISNPKKAPRKTFFNLIYFQKIPDDHMTILSLGYWRLFKNHCLLCSLIIS